MKRWCSSTTAVAGAIARGASYTKARALVQVLVLALTAFTGCATTSLRPPSGDSSQRVGDIALDQYVGLYEVAPGFAFTVSKEGARLMIEGMGFSRSELVWNSGNRFRNKGADLPVTFGYDGDGNISHLTVEHEGQPVQLTKVPPLSKRELAAFKQRSYLEVPIRGSETRSLRSSEIGQEYRLYVYLPRSYGYANRRYPAIYILDADADFGLAAHLIPQRAAGREIPELVIVGIAYGEGVPEGLNPRYRDFVPSAFGGQAEKYLNFLRRELIPFIDSEYRTDPSDRTICGHSLGGVFAAFVLFETPPLFSRYLVGAPGILPAAAEANYARAHSELAAKVFLTVGSLEGDKRVSELTEFGRTLAGRDYKGLEVTTRIIEGESHVSFFAEAFNRGLTALFHTK